MGSLLVLYEDSHSQYYSHFLKTYLAEGIVNEQNCIIVDSQDTFRDQKSWIKFLPNVAKTRDSDQKEESKAVEPENKKLEVAWRYNNLLSHGNP